MSINDSTNILFNSALLKVASRCNLDCDYCYMYHHADQSWREQPALMGDHIVQQFAHRLAEYVRLTKLKHFSVTYHGGEPLLYTAERLAQATATIRKIVSSSCELDFSIQTNGVLLNDESLSILKQANIFISLSLDGPQEVNDLHRLDHVGKSSFNETLAALKSLSANPSIFRGVISVIDPKVPAKKLFEFFQPFKLPSLDILLPDATHLRPPRGRDEDELLYRRWLTNAYEIWYDEYSSIPVRFFDGVLGSRLGVPSPTDAMGFGAVSLLVVETDGSYTDHDVFKITTQNAPVLNCNVFDTSFESVGHLPKLNEHSNRLKFDGIAEECRICPVVESCGGGSIMHRYHPIRKLDAPTVYCGELFDLFFVANKKLLESLIRSSNLQASSLEVVVQFNDKLERYCSLWRSQIEDLADSTVENSNASRGKASAASCLIMARKDNHLLSEKEKTNLVTHSTWLGNVTIQSQDPFLIDPFSKTIRLLAVDSDEFQYGISLLSTVESYLANLSPSLLGAINNLISDILFVEDITENASGIFSFSDDSAPNVIYIATYADGEPIDPDDLADSIFHEFLHQVLYHMEREEPMLYDYDFPRFPAPWRSGLRPAGGFLHGTYVFTGLAQFWTALAKSNLPNINGPKARQNAEKFKSQALYGINTLNQFALLTPRGHDLIQELLIVLGEKLSSLLAPGII